MAARPSAVFLVVCLLGLPASVPLVPAARAQAARPAALPTVVVDQVVTQPLTQTFPVIGRLVAVESGDVAARIAGPVERVLVEVGDRVETGDLLAEIDPRRLTLEVEAARAARAEAVAAVETAEASVAKMQQDVDRLTGLRQSAAFSQARFDDARQDLVITRSELAVARSRVARADVALKVAELNLAYSQIKAPYPGAVALRSALPGEYLSVGQPVVTLINDRRLEIEADVPVERIAGLTPGASVAVTLHDGSRTQATVRAVVPAENPLTRTRAVRFRPELEDAGMALALDQSATVAVPAGAPRPVLTVHKDAVILSPQGARVFVVGAEDKVEERRVRLGEALGERLEVLEGLSEGEMAVTRGNERLRGGQAVAPARQEG